MIRQLELFGPTEGAKPIKRTKSRQEQIEDYEGFLEKFADKKTTDDCYTPEPVYQAVIDFVRTLTPLDGRTIVRPFYPGGDYETYEYPADCIVIDNPPFSILAKILKFYDLHGVPFFLFAPALTLFSTSIDATFIISDVTITYENGAKVPTGFITNVIPDLRLWCCPEIGDAIERAQAAPPPVRRSSSFIRTTSSRPPHCGRFRRTASASRYRRLPAGSSATAKVRCSRDGPFSAADTF